MRASPFSMMKNVGVLESIAGRENLPHRRARYRQAECAPGSLSMIQQIQRRLLLPVYSEDPHAAAFHTASSKGRAEGMRLMLLEARPLRPVFDLEPSTVSVDEQLN